MNKLTEEEKYLMTLGYHNDLKRAYLEMDEEIMEVVSIHDLDDFMEIAFNPITMKETIDIFKSLVKVCTYKGLPYLCNCINWSAKFCCQEDSIESINMYNFKGKLVDFMNTYKFQKKSGYTTWFKNNIFYVELKHNKLQVSFHDFRNKYNGKRNNKHHYWSGEPTQCNSFILLDWYMKNNIPNKKERNLMS